MGGALLLVLALGRIRAAWVDPDLARKAAAQGLPRQVWLISTQSWGSPAHRAEEGGSPRSEAAQRPWLGQGSTRSAEAARCSEGHVHNRSVLDLPKTP